MILRLFPAFLFTVTAIAQSPAPRAVWVQQISGEPDPYAAGGTFRLMARELPGPPRVPMSTSVQLRDVRAWASPPASASAATPIHAPIRAAPFP